MDENSVFCATRGSEFQYINEFYVLKLIYTLDSCA